MILQEVTSEFSLQEFWKNYFLKGSPVIFRNLPLQKMHLQKLADHVSNLISNGRAKKIGASIWLSRDQLDDFILMPTWPDHCLKNKKTYFLYKDARLFSCPPGHLTSWHYDANLLFNFNLQLIGKKKWELISPHTNFKYYSFTHYGLINQDVTLLKNETAEFTLFPGDMLYIPPLWIHQVTSLDEDSLSVSWMAANDQILTPSKVYQREKEILKLANIAKIIKLDGVFTKLMGYNKKYLIHYAGRGQEYIDKLVERISTKEALSRLIKELCGLPYYFHHRKRIKTAKFQPKMMFFEN